MVRFIIESCKQKISRHSSNDDLLKQVNEITWCICNEENQFLAMIIWIWEKDLYDWRDRIFFLVFFSSNQSSLFELKTKRIILLKKNIFLFSFFFLFSFLLSKVDLRSEYYVGAFQCQRCEGRLRKGCCTLKLPSKVSITLYLFWESRFLSVRENAY